MVDAEVLRLRRLRKVALRTRALGKVLDADPAADGAFSRGTVLCWTIARIATGRLRAHPFLSYQQGHGQIAKFVDAALAAALATAARRHKRELQVFADHLQALTRVVDDVRSVSWAPDLSDALGRMQIQLRRLTGELAYRLPAQAVSAAAARSAVPAVVVDDNSWPYLAI